MNNRYQQSQQKGPRLYFYVIYSISHTKLSSSAIILCPFIVHFVYAHTCVHKVTNEWMKTTTHQLQNRIKSEIVFIERCKSMFPFIDFVWRIPFTASLYLSLSPSLSVLISIFIFGSFRIDVLIKMYQCVANAKGKNEIRCSGSGKCCHSVIVECYSHGIYYLVGLPIFHLFSFLGADLRARTWISMQFPGAFDACILSLA